MFRPFATIGKTNSDQEYFVTSVLSNRIFHPMSWRSRLYPMTSCHQKRRGFVLENISASLDWLASWSKQQPHSTWYNFHYPHKVKEYVSVSTTEVVI